MADVSIVSAAELDAIASVSGFAIWELEQVVSDVNFRFLVDEFRAERLGQVVNPEQALAAPSQIGQAVQAFVVSGPVTGILDALETSAVALRTPIDTIVRTIKDIGLTTVVVVIAVGIILLKLKAR